MIKRLAHNALSCSTSNLYPSCCCRRLPNYGKSVLEFSLRNPAASHIANPDDDSVTEDKCWGSECAAPYMHAIPDPAHSIRVKPMIRRIREKEKK
jgi:hypothetical protein